MSFVVIWFGVAALAVAMLSYLIPFGSAVSQLTVIALIALTLLFTLRSKAIKRFLKESEPVKDDFFDVQGKGIISSGKVYFKATLWEIEPSLEKFEEDEIVNVLGTHNGVAKIEKLKP